MGQRTSGPKDLRTKGSWVNALCIATQVSKEGQNLNFAISAETIRDAVSKSAVVFPAPPPVAVVTPTLSVAASSAEDYFNRAFQEVNSGNYESGIIDYSEAIRLKPDNADAYYDRGLVFKDRKQYGTAISDFTEAIRLKPDDALSFGGRGNVFMDLEEYGNAISDFTEAIRLKPDFALAYESRAFAYDKLGKSSMAAQDRKKAKELGGR